MKNEWTKKLEKQEAEIETLKIELADVYEKYYKQEERHETELCQAFGSGAFVMFLIVAIGFVVVYLAGKVMG